MAGDPVAVAECQIQAILMRLEVDTRRPIRHIELRVGWKGDADPGRWIAVSLVDQECVSAYGRGWRRDERAGGKLPQGTPA